MQIPKLRFKEFNDDWKEKKLNNFLTESQIKGTNGKTAKKLSVKLWAKGVVEKKEILEGSMETQYYTRHSGQLIYGKLDFLNCAFGIIPKELDGYQSTADVPAFDIKNINSKFLLNKIIQKNFYQKYGDIADGTRKAKRIHTDTFLNMSIYLPSLEEQTKIANFLSLIDRKIELQEKLVENLKLYKKGLLQKVFSNNHGWKKVKIGSCITQISNRNKNNIDYDVLSVSNLKGFIKQTEQFNDRELASENKSNYKVVDKYEFAYNPARINVGSIAMLEKFNCGIVSPMYVCFKCNNIYHSFLKYFFLTNEFKNQMKMRLEGSVRMCLSYEALSNINIKIPSIEEQNRIANLFSNLDKKMDFETKKLQDLKTYKKGLLQKMFL